MIELIVIFGLLILGYVFGQIAEKKHYKSIRKREQEQLAMPVVSFKTIPATVQVKHSFMVTGNVVISIDYFKRMLAALKNIFGGRIISYESLLDRARREAILRLKESAREQKANSIYNLRLETSSISNSTRQNVGSVEVIAYGTAIVEIRP